MSAEAMFKAIEENDASVISELVKNLAKITMDMLFSDRKMTPLMYAASINKVDAIVAVLQAGADIEESFAVENGLNSPLFLAVYSGHKEAVQVLLERAANPNKPDLDGNLPIMRALVADNYELALLLRLHGAEVPTAQGLELDDETRAELSQAFGGGQFQQASKSTEKKIPELHKRHARLMSDWFSPDVGKARAALERFPVLLNIRAKEAEAALYQAVRKGMMAKLHFLLEKGADTERLATDGSTALYALADSKSYFLRGRDRQAAFSALLKAGANFQTAQTFAVGNPVAAANLVKFKVAYDAALLAELNPETGLSQLSPQEAAAAVQRGTPTASAGPVSRHSILAGAGGNRPPAVSCAHRQPGFAITEAAANEELAKQRKSDNQFFGL